MKSVIKSQMLFVSGRDGEEFQENYNSAMTKLAESDIKIDERTISIEKLSAIILYTEKLRIPETLKDEYELKGIHLTCDSCPYYEPVTDRKGLCPNVRNHRTGSHEIYADDDICTIRWNYLEKELKDMKERTKYEVSQFRGRTCEVESDEKRVGGCA